MIRETSLLPRFILTVSTCAAMLAVPGAAQADSAPQGAIIVRLNDGVGNGRCIASTDKLTINLRRVFLEKRSKWLGLIEDESLAVTYTTRLSGLAGIENRTASFAKVDQYPVQQYDAGMVSLAIERALLDRFPLTTPENQFTAVDLEVGIVRTRGKSTATKVLLGAISTTKSLPLPANPFSAGFNVATTYVDSLFKPLLDSAAAEKEAVTHNILMSISPSNCSGGDDERTGTKAIIDASDDYQKPGYIDTSKGNSYCFKAELTPSFTLKFATKPTSGDCAQATGFQNLRNSHMGFYVNALPSTAPNPVGGNMFATLPDSNKSLGLGSALEGLGMTRSIAKAFSKALLARNGNEDVAKALRIETDAVAGYRDALGRCEANGISPADCIGS